MRESLRWAVVGLVLFAAVPVGAEDLPLVQAIKAGDVAGVDALLAAGGSTSMRSSQMGRPRSTGRFAR